MYTKTAVLWVIMRYSWMRTWSFEGRYRLNFQGWKVGEARNQFSSPPASKCFLLGLLFNPENGGILFLTVTDVRTTDPAQNVQNSENCYFLEKQKFSSAAVGLFFFSPKWLVGRRIWSKIFRTTALEYSACILYRDCDYRRGLDW